MKMVILMRTDLNMRKGKMVAQGAHASLACLIDDNISDRSLSELKMNIAVISDTTFKWFQTGMKKICLKVRSEQELKELIQKAKESGLVAYTVTDAGYTEFNGVSTITCGAIGPAEDNLIDEITGNLELL